MPICSTQPIRHGRDLLHVVPSPPLHHPARPRGLSLMTYNFCNIRGFGIAQAIQVVHIRSFDLMILTDIDITDKAYCHNRLACEVVWQPSIMTADGGSLGGVSLVIRDQPQE